MSLRRIHVEVSEAVLGGASDVVGSFVETDESVVFVEDFFGLDFVGESFDEVVFGFVEDRVSRSLEQLLVSQERKPDGLEEFSLFFGSEASHSHSLCCLFPECFDFFVILPLDFAFVVESVEGFFLPGLFFFLWVWRRFFSGGFDCGSFGLLLFFGLVGENVGSVADVLLDTLKDSGFIVDVEFAVFHEVLEVSERELAEEVVAVLGSAHLLELLHEQLLAGAGHFLALEADSIEVEIN